MNRIAVILCALAAPLLTLFWTAPAQAQATRTWVSGVGDDANPCNLTAPCKTFAGAISKTAARGVITCRDPGGFGGVTITKSITISCADVDGGILAAGVNGIVINAASTDIIVLEGIDIDGVGTGLAGVRILSGSAVYITNCTIRRMTGNAVDLVGASSARAFIEDSEFSFNGGGVNVQGNGAGVANSAIIDRTIIHGNANFSLKVSSAGTALISNSVFSGSPAGIDAAAGANVTSYGNNVIRGTGLPTTTSPLL